MDLIKELFDLSPQNQECLAEALNIDGDYESIWEEYENRVIGPFCGSKRSGKAGLRRAKEAIEEYKKAFPEDVSGIVFLMLHFVECATEYTIENGEMYEGSYEETEDVLENLVEVVKSAREGFHLTDEHEICFIRLVELASQLDWETEHRVQDLVAEVLGHRGWRG
jgi:hypothetical protein